ncbi:MAG: hypothetical protein FWE36_08540, partial [Erysipelotrichales bacterium]|nr:hypothetical protein [Erysipelotrichales bacterium]
SYISPCDLEEMLYNIHEAGSFNLYTIGNPIYFPQAWHNINNSYPVAFDPEELPSRNWRRVWVSLGTLALLYGVTALSKGTLLPFTAPKKKGAKAALFGAWSTTKPGTVALGASRSVIARGVGDFSEFIITRENPYKTLEDAFWGYGISIVTGGLTGGMPSEKWYTTAANIVAQPLISEAVSWRRTGNFDWDSLAFNMIARSLTRDMSPLEHGLFRGGSRGVRKRNI